MTTPDARLRGGAELETKLRIVRDAMARSGLAGLRLRRHDWFAWLTCGGSNALLQVSELGVAEAVVTADGMWVVTDSIEAARIATEELPADVPVVDGPWAERGLRDRLVRDLVAGGPIASDVAAPGEIAMPGELAAARRRLVPAEIERYRALGRDAAEAMTEVLAAVRPEATEFDLTGAGTNALWRRGIHPALALVAGEDRLPRYRHPTPSAARIGDLAMVVFCARRHGLYANLTRFVAFRELSKAERAAHRAVAEVEAVAWSASRPGAVLGDVFSTIVAAYPANGYPGAEAGLHQGGPTGYLAREEIALPDSDSVIAAGNALAWNPSVPGAKIEDTVLVTGDGLEILTADPAWPAVEVHGRPRPVVLTRP